MLSAVEGTITCTRKFSIDIGHRILNHESRCRYPHGHSVEIEITCQSPELDTLGRVIDFGKIKSIVGEFLDRELDHNFILCKDDPFLTELPESRMLLLFGRKPYVLENNPTSENLAKHICLVANNLLNPHYIWVPKVRFHETRNCFADFDSEYSAKEWEFNCDVHKYENSSTPEHPFENLTKPEVTNGINSSCNDGSSSSDAISEPAACGEAESGSIGNP